MLKKRDTIKIKNIFIIIKKELLLYLVSFSNFLVLAGTIGVVMFLFMNSFYMVNVAELNNLFGLLPWVFTLLIPAITMGIIAQERKSKTLQFLLANPVNELEIVIGKFWGAMIFLVVFIGATMIAPISLNAVAEFDWGIILSGYLAILLLAGTLLALDLFISSFFSNQIAAFVAALLGNAFLVILGSDLLANFLPANITDLIAVSSPLHHYLQLSRGRVTFADLSYFMLIITAFITLGYWQLNRIKYHNAIKTLFSLNQIPAHLVAIALIASSFFVNYIPGQIDLTSQKKFTLSEGSKEIITTLPEPITIDLYLSQDLPPAFQPQVDDVNLMTEQIKSIDRSKVQVNRKYPGDNQETQQEALALGIYPQSFSVLSQSEYQAKEGYLGMNITYKDKSRAIPFISSTDNFEYQVMSLIYDISNDAKPKIVYLQQIGGVDLNSQAFGLVDALMSSYTFETITLPAADAEERLVAADVESKIILLVNPTNPINPADMQTIESQIKTGTSLLVFGNGVDLDVDTLTATQPEMVAVNDLLKSWDLQLNADIVYDLENANLLSFNTNQGRMFLTYPFWPTTSINSSIPIYKDLGGVTIPWPSSVEILNSEKVRPLLSTGDYSGSQTENFNLAPQQNLRQDNLSAKNVGAIKSRTETDGSVIVIGSLNLLLDNFGSSGNNNLIFLNQTFDLAAQNNSLSSIRSKNRIAPQLVFENQQQKESLRYLNLIGPSATILATGMIFMYLRKRKQQQTFA